MGISINDEGWRRATARLDSDEVVERLGMSPERIAEILTGRDAPCAQFIASALSAFPMRFIDLFEVTP